ncbi:MAG: LUD domain-containing protein, partial [Gammaproteobacteria bacterium]|nr:LUD domain-containing protein [Gammaproteobacteria bacterium]
IEKIVPNLEDATTILRLLTRSATGQEISVYSTLFSGPKRPTDLDGPETFHVVLVDNGRSQMLGNEFHEMLRCIRCGACLNHCPVYGAVGGHAYGWVYPGPVGSVLTPLMVGLREAADLPNACTLNGRCEEVCPMSIPLPSMLRALRVREFQAGLPKMRVRWALAAWAFMARRPKLYRRSMGAAIKLMSALGRKRGRFRSLPLARGWTLARDFPSPQGATFQSQWRSAGGGGTQ